MILARKSGRKLGRNTARKVIRKRNQTKQEIKNVESTNQNALENTIGQDSVPVPNELNSGE